MVGSTTLLVMENGQVNWLGFALLAAFLTSFLPIVNKRLLAEVSVSVVAWGVDALSLPLIGLAALLLIPTPTVDNVFWLGIVGSAALNIVATLLSPHALKRGDALMVTPILTFNPAFTALVALLTLGKMPTRAGLAGILTIIANAYALNRTNDGGHWWSPFLALGTDPAMLLAVMASVIWGLTPITEKLAMEHSRLADPPLVAFDSTALMTLFLVLPMLRERTQPLRYFRFHRGDFTVAATIAGIAPIFGFTAVGLGLVG